MSSFNVLEPISSVKTVEEFDALLEKYQKLNPAKYAIKLGNGEFDRFRKTLIGYEPKEEPVEQKVEENTAEERPARRGRPASK